MTVIIAFGVALAAVNASYQWSDVRHWLPDLLTGVGLVLVGLYVMGNQRATGVLLSASGLTWFLGNFSPALLLVHRGPLLHATVFHPARGRRSVVEFGAIGAVYALAFIPPVWRQDRTAIIAGLVFVTLAVWRVAASTGRQRRQRLVALLTSVMFAGAIVVTAVIRLAVPSDVGGPLLFGYELAIGAVAAVFAVTAARSTSSELADVVVDLHEIRSDEFQARLTALLGDPTVEIGYRTHEGTYVSMSGLPVEIPDELAARAATFVEVGNEPVAVVAHDRAVLESPMLLEALETATKLNADNASLTEAVRRQVDEISASRQRLVAASDAERRRLEYRLHTGVERTVADLAEQLRSIDASTDGPAGAHLRRAAEHLTATVDDLRQLERGLHPRELDGGIEGALVSLAKRCVVPVRLTIADDVAGEISDPVSIAAYYTCSEALSNVVKHASASSVLVEVFRANDELVIVVDDNGIGFEDQDLLALGTGSGLRGLADRVEAIGGRLNVSSRFAGGTRLEVHVPLPCGVLPDHQIRAQIS